MAKATMVIVPRRISVTSAVHLFAEPRFAWRVATEAPFVAAKEPAWQIIGISHAENTVEYVSEANAPRTVAQLMNDAGEEALTREAEWPVIRFLPLDDLEHGAIAPEQLAFSYEAALERTAANAHKAEAEKPKKAKTRTASNLGRGLKDLTGGAVVVADEAKT
jgi:hypothetical protein